MATTFIPVTPSSAPIGAARAADFIGIDLTAPSSYADGPPFDAFDALRSSAPVAWHDEKPRDRKYVPLGGGLKDDPGFWAVTSHELVSHVSRTPETFSSWLGGVSLASLDEDGLAATRAMMINMDGSAHGRIRQLVRPLFSTRAIRIMSESIARISEELVDDMIADGEVEFVSKVAAELPICVLADLLGIPREERHLLLKWTNAITFADDPDLGSLDALVEASTEMAQYGQRIAEDRRRHPRGDLISLIATAEIDGERLNEAEMAAFWNLLVVAGNETTRNAIAGGIVEISSRGLWSDLRSQPELVRTAVAEVLRFVTPVMQFRRTAVRDVVLGDQQIRAGDKVVMFYAAANRDPDVFVDPHNFQIDRSPNLHLSFGVGAHACLGAQLARLEMSTLYGEMIKRIRDIEVIGKVVGVQSNSLRQIAQVPVRVNRA